MKATCWLGLSSAIGATALGLWLTGILASAAEPPRDTRKREIEQPVEKVIAATEAAPQVPPAVEEDRRKKKIERPVENVIAAAAAGNFDNPKVEPGMVRWHASFDDACKAAQKSGKPVLLFQLLGQLDQRFT